VSTPLVGIVAPWPLPLAQFSEIPGVGWVLWLAGLAIAAVAVCELLGLRYIANNRVGIVEKLWSAKGSIPEGRIIALNGEAGYQADILRGGIHFGLWRWQYRIHRVPLVTVPQGKIGYVYARDGEPLLPSQTLARVVPCNNFQNTRGYLIGKDAGPDGESLIGQRGRQRAILREGVYALNLAQFIVVTEETVYRLDVGGQRELRTVVGWQSEMNDVAGFSPVVVGGPVECRDPLMPEKTMMVDSIAIVSVQDGPSLIPGEIIAPAVGFDNDGKNYHNNYQDPEAFLRAGGRRGKQYVPLTDGTYFINRWFATVEAIPKTVVPIGYVGVIVSYYGRVGQDVSGEGFRHGERVAEGERGVLEKPLGPGKYAFNTYAGSIVLVPTTNFVLHWVTGRTESHRYDESLRSIDLVTKDAYEPNLPLSVVVHIDYQKAPSVIQRFGDVKKLITQTLDPMLSAYFRDVAHKRTMLALLQDRDSIQHEARDELRRKFGDFDIECVDVLIGKPDTAEAGGSGKIETLLEQLRLRQLSIEQVETFGRQVTAAEKLKNLNEAQAVAEMQKQLTNSLVQVQIAENEGEAALARARKQADQMVVTAQAESQQRVLAGRGESSRVLQVGLSEATVLLRKIQSFSDPRLYALAQVAERLSKSTQPLVPERVFIAGGVGSGTSSDGSQAAAAGQGLLGLLLSLLVAEKSGFQMSETSESPALQELADKMARQALEAMQANIDMEPFSLGGSGQAAEVPTPITAPESSPEPVPSPSPAPASRPSAPSSNRDKARPTAK
jgi:uncharacterized membrane protein YqiK